MKRVAIYGGSFNPIHMGHLALARYVVAKHLADEVWMMVSPQNPLKKVEGLLPEADRLRLAQLATANESQIRVSDFECHLPRPSYTYLTLRALHEAHPDIVFSLLIGADNWTRFDRWVKPEEILAHHRILVYPRPEYPIDAATLPDGVSLLDAPLFPYSSTDIRQRLVSGENVSEMLTPAVLSAIKAEGLYSCKH
ncbi:MAG: nicotinate (nicotinamide) nucleotide adenylyltransferase [Bacteroidales bacterium]|nr:nicotinate (nicotinamide) nucleotide adenylyltransferase [Bacteroidales bacterium]